MLCSSPCNQQAAATRETELEGNLKAQSDDAKKALDEAKQREDAKLQLEKT